MYTIIDNLLNEEEYNKIYNTFMGPFIPWYYNNSVILRVTPDLEKDVQIAYNKYDFQFVHILYTDHTIQSNLFESIIPILKKLEVCAILRAKLNLIPQADIIHEHGWHTDVEVKNAKTAVYYINTNNGYTLLSDGTKIESVGNRLVIFPSEVKHTGTTCTDSKVRVALNLNYYTAN